MAVLLKDPKDMGEATHLKTHHPSKILRDFIHLIHKVISFRFRDFNWDKF